MIKVRRAGVFAALLFICFSAAAFPRLACAGGEFVFVRGGNSVCTIVAGDDDGRGLAFTMERSNVSLFHPDGVMGIAARELAGHLNDMAMIPEHRQRRQVEVVQDTGDARTDYRVLLGTAAIAEYGLEREAAEMCYWSYTYRVEGRDLLIFGSSTQGAANGVYGFMRDELGVRWYGPGELFRVMPEGLDTIEVRVGERRVEPDFAPARYSITGLHENPAGRWARRMNVLNLNAPAAGHFPFFFRAHPLRGIMPVSEYGDRPELYAVRGGRRWLDERRFAVCYSNPEAAAIIAGEAKKWFAASEHRHTFPMGINDSQAYCECEECAELQPARAFRGRPVASDMYYHFINNVARMVREEYPGRYLAVLAYNDVTAPPLGEVEDNVLVVLVNDISEYYDAGQRSRDHEVLRQWSEKGVKLGTYYYPGLAKLVPAYFPTFLSEELNLRKELGGVMLCSEVGPGWPWKGPMHYVEARLWWDAGLDVDEVLEEYFSDLYGPAAPYMSELFSLFDEIHMRPRSGGFLYEHYNYQQFRPYGSGDYERIEQLLASAHGAVEGLGVGPRGREGREGQRVAYVSSGLRVFRDMLEGRVLALELEGASGRIDDVEAVERLEKVERIGELIARHEALYRETILSDKSHAPRYLNDTCTPVRTAWKKHLSSAVGETLVELYNAAAGLDGRGRSRLERAVNAYREDPGGEAHFMLGTGQWELEEPNLVLNPGFESMEGEHPDYPEQLQWRLSGADNWAFWQSVRIKAGEFTSTGEVSRTGARSGQVKGVGRGSFIGLAPGIIPGEYYYFEAYVKNATEAEEGTTVRVHLDWLDEKGDLLRQRSEHLVKGLDEWIRADLIVKAPEDANKSVIIFIVNDLEPGRSVYFDDVKLNRITTR